MVLFIQHSNTMSTDALETLGDMSSAVIIILNCPGIFQFQHQKGQPYTDCHSIKIVKLTNEHNLNTFKARQYKHLTPASKQFSNILLKWY